MCALGGFGGLALLGFRACGKKICGSWSARSYYPSNDANATSIFTSFLYLTGCRFSPWAAFFAVATWSAAIDFFLAGALNGPHHIMGLA